MEGSGRVAALHGSSTLNGPYTTKDLARRGGCSVQHVRDLEREGAIPPAARAENGYRRFTDCHLHALLAYQALSQALGPLGAKRLMCLALTSPRRDVVAGIDEAHGHLHAERQALLRARSAALAITAKEIDTPLPSGSHAEIAQALDTRARRLDARSWALLDAGAALVDLLRARQ